MTILGLDRSEISLNLKGTFYDTDLIWFLACIFVQIISYFIENIFWTTLAHKDLISNNWIDVQPIMILFDKHQKMDL